MANEATLVFETELPLPFTVANATGIEKGSLLKLADLNTASLADGANDILAGIAAQEKIASDGKVKLAIYPKGIFKMMASGAIPVGLAVCSHGNANVVKLAPVTVSGAAILGHALETAADGETFLVNVSVGSGGNQIS